jgi:hypothetical protein
MGNVETPNLHSLPSTRLLPWVLLLVFAAGIVGERVYLYRAPLYGDICGYALIGHEMLSGRKLYSDLWERKPPLLYATFSAAELIVGYGRREIFLVNVVATLTTLVMVYIAGAGFGAGRGGAIVAAALWTILSCDLDLTARQPDPEVFINLFIAAAIALLVHWPKARSIKAALLLGAMMAAATLYKHNIAIVCLFLCAAHALFPLSDSGGQKRNRDRWIESLCAGVVLILVWAGLFIYFAAAGRLHAFVDVLFHQNAAYSGSFAQNLARALRPDRLFPSWMMWAVGPAALILGAAMMKNWRGRSEPEFRRRCALWIAWVIGTWTAIALTGHLYPHYYQLWIPVWCIGGGWAGAALIRSQTKTPGWFRYALVAGAFSFLLVREGSQFRLTPQQWLARQFSYFNVQEQNDVGLLLGRLLKPNEQFWELGDDNALYFLSKHSPPSGLLFIDPLIYGDETREYWGRLVADLDRTNPDLVILSSAWLYFIPPDAPVFAWIDRNYVLCTPPVAPPTYRFWLRRGSDLQVRLMGPGPTP